MNACSPFSCYFSANIVKCGYLGKKQKCQRKNFVRLEYVGKKTAAWLQNMSRMENGAGNKWKFGIFIMKNANWSGATMFVVKKFRMVAITW